MQKSVVSFAHALVFGALCVAGFGCRAAVTPAQYVKNYGPGFSAALDAADAADKAYSLIADTSVTEFRSSEAKRTELATLVTTSRDAYRRARSYKLPCQPNEGIAGADVVGAEFYDVKWAYSRSSNSDRPYKFALEGRSVSLIVVDQLANTSEERDSGWWTEHVNYVMSSRGRVIMALSCKREWRTNDVGNGRWSPEFARVFLDESRFGEGFAPLLVGDSIDIDDIVVSIKR